MVGNFNYNGCFQDLVDGMTRILPYNVLVDPLMTLEMCAANCNAFDFFGTEFGDEVCLLKSQLCEESLLIF